MFKIFQIEVERQLEKKIKFVRSDIGGEYYGCLMKEEDVLDLLQGIYKKMEY
ncbi:unnamed protein product [Prunus brigantina]